MHSLRNVALCALLMTCVWGQTQGDESPHKSHHTGGKKRVVAGKADVLLTVPKKFAQVVDVDPAKRKVRLHIEGDEAPTTWQVNADAEIKIHGWWGRLTQLESKDRVWVWFDIDRQKQPTGILMLADEVSEKDIHGATKPDEFERLRMKQREYLRRIWREKGLPGAVSVLHKLSGEMDVLLDHEAIRWGRYLNNGNRVTLQAKGKTPIKAAVKHVRPWRERTLIRLATSSGVDQADLVLGQRVHLLVHEPPEEVQDSDLPTDIGRDRSKKERIEWFLASIYCTCRINKDRCTGMFYTLASCNPNTCGNPNTTIETLNGLINEGKSDYEILDHLRKNRGSDLLKPHLLK